MSNEDPKGRVHNDAIVKKAERKWRAFTRQIFRHGHGLTNDRLRAKIEEYLKGLPVEEQEATYTFFQSSLRGTDVEVYHDTDATFTAEMTTEFPPRMGEYVLYLFVKKEYRESLLGDLEQDYQEVLEKFGVRKAKFWYYAKVAQTIGPLIRPTLKRFFKWSAVAWIGDNIRRFIP